MKKEILGGQDGKRDIGSAGWKKRGNGREGKRDSGNEGWR